MFKKPIPFLLRKVKQKNILEDCIKEMKTSFNKNRKFLYSLLICKFLLFYFILQISDKKKKLN